MLINGDRSDYSICLERGNQEGHENGRSCSDISKEEVRDVLRKMNTGKAIGSYLIPMEI